MGLSRRRTRAQGYAEFGISIAVVALVAMLGLDQVRGVIYTYFKSQGLEQSLNPPTPTPGIAPTNTQTLIVLANCRPVGPWTVDVVKDFCSVTVTPAPTQPSPYILLGTSASGPNDGVHGLHTSMNSGGPWYADVPCDVSGGICTFSYVPPLSGPQTLTAWCGLQCVSAGFVQSRDQVTVTVN